MISRVKFLLLLLLGLHTLNIQAARLQWGNHGAALFNPQDSKDHLLIGNVSVVVTVPSKYRLMGRTRKLIVKRNDTVEELKMKLEKEFPGYPPVELQRIFQDARQLQDSEVIGEISSQSQVNFTMDMLTGTHVYNKTNSVAEALEALITIDVHLAANGQKQMEIVGSNNNNTIILGDGSSKSALYENLFATLNHSFYAEHSSEIENALFLEKDPDTISADTALWRDTTVASNKYQSVLALVLCRELNLYKRSLLPIVGQFMFLAVRNYNTLVEIYYFS